MDEKRQAQLQQDWQTLDAFIEGAKHTSSTREIAAMRNAFDRVGGAVSGLITEHSEALTAMTQAREQLEGVTEELNALKAKYLVCPEEAPVIEAEAKPEG
jgi:chromosome segregation ATPase